MEKFRAGFLSHFFISNKIFPRQVLLLHYLITLQARAVALNWLCFRIYKIEQN